eukprot:scaffold808_cov67-Phaeocystis_antarctica.AAC.4
MQEGLGLDRLVDAHHAAEELVVGRLGGGQVGCHHGELHEGVGGELVLDDAHLAEASEVEGAGLILVHQVGEPHLCEADGLLELRGEAPADVVRRGVGRQLVGLAEGARAAHLQRTAAGWTGAAAGSHYGRVARRTWGLAAPRSRELRPEIFEILAAKRMMVEAKRSETKRST